MSQDGRPEFRGIDGVRPSPVGQFASTVISVVRDQQTVTGAGVRQFVLDHLMRAILSPGTFVASDMLVELRAHRLGVDPIIDAYIPSAARALGRMWISDDASFAQVTIGALRLQALLGVAAAEIRFPLVSAEKRVSNLIVVPQNEQHFLGAHVVAAQLRRIGCEVATSFDETLGELRFRIRQSPPDLVLITTAQVSNLDKVCPIVQTVRQALPKESVIALGGSVLGDHDEVKEKTGVDIVTSSIRDAINCYKERAKAQSKQ